MSPLDVCPNCGKRHRYKSCYCSILDCQRPVYGNGLCNMHWQQKRVAENPEVAEKKRAYSRWYGKNVLQYATPEHHAYQADIRLRRWFNIPTITKGGPEGLAGIAEYERRLVLQNGVCAMCRRPPKDGKRLCVDHKHESSALRGLLCDACNGKVLGRLERYKCYVTIPQIIAYLQKFDPQNVLLKSIPDCLPDRAPKSNPKDF